MSKIQIKTTQNILLAFEPASLGERIAAYVIDLVLIMGYSYLVTQLVFEHFSYYYIREAIAIYLILMLPATFYSVIAESLMQGQTIGKRILKIRVLKIDGYQASFADFFVRWLFGLIELLIFFGSVAFAAIISSKYSQRLGDLAAGTAVITERNKLNISHTILEEVSQSYQPLFTQTEVLRFSDRDVQTIKNYLTKALKNKNEKTLTRLADKITEVSQHSNTTFGNQADFIQQFLRDYSFYTMK